MNFRVEKRKPSKDEEAVPKPKKHKKEHKHKHGKKHGDEKVAKTKKHKKHKKHKRKTKEPPSPEHYTPERVEPDQPVANGKEAANKPNSTEIDHVTEFITDGLTLPKQASLEGISSEENSVDVPELDCDSDAIDMSVIEADMDLEELMKQKELLQAKLAGVEVVPEVRKGVAENVSKVSKVSSVVEEIISVLDSDEEPEKKKSKKESAAARERIRDKNRLVKIFWLYFV